ncbi:MAG: hypothetical protein Kow0062_23010 [Acidobacteriota bacterium]
MSGPAFAPCATAGPDAGRLLLERQVERLAGEVAEATRRLARALEDKDRLGRILNSVIETLEAGVILVGDGGRPLAHNAAARSMGAVHPAADGWRLAGCLPAACAQGRVEGRPLRPAGDDGPAWLVRSTPVDLGPEGRAVVLLVSDVTETLALEERAHRRSRLENLGRAVAEIAHQIRNPLGGIELFASMLIDDLADRPREREIAEQILVTVRSLSGTVTHLLGTVRGGRTVLRASDLVALVEEVVASVRPIAEARTVRLEVAAPAGPVTAPVDGEALRQAVLNLVANALDVSPPEAVVRVTVGRAGETAVITVDDAGPGVPERDRPRIFEPFWSTRPDGTGLGLAVVERVALAHGGSVRVGRSPLGGARFELAVPMDGAGRADREGDEA